jgi:leader peptidase (prepilin peptidase)/N-methyltransferase
LAALAYTYRWAVAVALIGVAASFALLPLPGAAFAAVLAALAVYVAIVDLEHFIIPDAANIAIFVTGIALVVTEAWPIGPLGDLEDALLRAFAAGAFLWLLRFVYARATGIEGLGLGDVKLAAAGAPFLAWETLPLALALGAVACALALAARALMRRERIDRTLELPFGAFLAPAIWVAFVLDRLGFFLV